MLFMFCTVIALAVAARTVEASPAKVIVRQTTNDTQLLTDLATISGYWGQITPYTDNAEDYFGVQWVGLPSGCQVEQAHTLQRHANRFPTSSWTFSCLNGTTNQYAQVLKRTASMTKPSQPKS